MWGHLLFEQKIRADSIKMSKTLGAGYWGFSVTRRSASSDNSHPASPGQLRELQSRTLIARACQDMRGDYYADSPCRCIPIASKMVL